MTINEFRERAFCYALEQGCEAAELRRREDKNFEVNAQGGEIDRYAVSRTASISLRVKLNGKDGFALTECIDDPEELVRRAMDNARVIECGDEHPMQGRCEYRTIERKATALDGMDESEKIRLALQLERDTLAADACVQRVMYCEVGSEASRIGIYNTLGLCAEREGSLGYCYTMPVVQKGEQVQNAMAFRVGDEAADTADCAKEAVSESIALLDGEPVTSGSYAVILRHDAMADLLHAFSPVFSADEAQKGRSLLAGKEGEAVAAPCVTIVDDPFHAYAPRAFDGEGTPSVTKNVVEDGTLKTLLHNLKTAKKAGCESTGNGLPAPGGVAPTVLYIRPGGQTLEALLADMDDGLLITQLEGLHAGLDPVSGDFSLKAAGRRIVAGRDAGAVSQITVAGNFFALLNAVERVGADLKFALPGSVCVGSPSIRVRSLMVAGK